ncbi:YciI family protein [Hoeflea sp. CAU 1731]
MSKNIIQLEKLLRMNLYLIFSKPEASKEEIKSLLQEHLQNQVRLEREGVLFGAGPVFDESGEPVCGMFILRADSFEAARAIADRDPLHRAGLRSYTIQRWLMNEGSLSMTVRFSDQSAIVE